MIRDYSRKFKLEMALNASIGGQKTKIYKVWEWLLENGEAKPVDIFRAFPELKQDYSTLKIGVEEGALIKNGRLYSANPDFKFRGNFRFKYATPVNKHTEHDAEPINEPEEVEEEIEVIEDKPKNKTDIKKGEFYLDYEDDIELEFNNYEIMNRIDFLNQDIAIISRWNDMYWVNKRNSTHLKGFLKKICDNYKIDKPLYLITSDYPGLDSVPAKNISRIEKEYTNPDKGNGLMILAKYIGPNVDNSASLKEKCILNDNNWEFNINCINNLLSKGRIKN